MKKILFLAALAMCVTLHSDAQKKNQVDSCRVKVISGNIVVSPTDGDAARFNKAMKRAGKNAAKFVSNAANFVGACSSQNALTNTYVSPTTPYKVIEYKPAGNDKKNSGQTKKSSKK